MTILQAVLYGVLQGLTEFLPISSSGHLFLLPTLFGWSDPGAGFTAVIQLGTIAAVLIYFRNDLMQVAREWTAGVFGGDRTSLGARVGWGIILGSVPIVFAGLLLEKEIDQNFRTAWIVGGSLIFFGLLMGVSEKSARQTKKYEDVTIKDAIVMGFWQCLALIPGSSRSGSTITGGLFGGLERAAAARLSFLLSVPAVLGSGLYKLYKEREVLMGSGLTPTIVATFVAFVSGWIAIDFLMKFLRSNTTWVFVWYRVALGVLVIGLALSGTIPPTPSESGGLAHVSSQATPR
ncbi:MAG: undecaprenyl-diphosphatase UppP [Fimbriimonadaceae bacterium]|nr:undecaprenyl-diphosphatase UppP [Fimbriimonadaceae bacterium]